MLSDPQVASRKYEKARGLGHEVWSHNSQYEEMKSGDKYLVVAPLLTTFAGGRLYFIDQDCLMMNKNNGTLGDQLSKLIHKTFSADELRVTNVEDVENFIAVILRQKSVDGLAAFSDHNVFVVFETDKPVVGHMVAKPDRITLLALRNAIVPLDTLKVFTGAGEWCLYTGTTQHIKPLIDSIRFIPKKKFVKGPPGEKDTFETIPGKEYPSMVLTEKMKRIRHAQNQILLRVEMQKSDILFQSDFEVIAFAAERFGTKLKIDQYRPWPKQTAIEAEMSKTVEATIARFPEFQPSTRFFERRATFSGVEVTTETRKAVAQQTRDIQSSRRKAQLAAKQKREQTVNNAPKEEFAF